MAGRRTHGDPRIAAEAGAAAEGAISGAAWHPSLATPGNAAFVAGYAAANGRAPDQFAAQAYVGVRRLAQAMQAADDPYDRAAVRAALAAIRGASTILGTFQFNEARNPAHPPVVQVVQDGAFELF
ncbi:MAG: ABC transporter substrate-binding protein [Fimbriimonadaceae bacterium]|nr:ABC transporter substrate-binding protein [Fimbriimonadaceae bacterium]